MSGTSAAGFTLDVRGWTGVGLGVFCIVIGLGALFVLGGFNMSAALTAAARGTFGSFDAVLSVTLVRATPLILCGLAVSLAFRAGVLNIGADGQLLGGAIATTAVLGMLKPGGMVAVAIALLAGMIAGAAMSAIPALLRWRFGVLEVISSIMMNFIAIYLVGWLVRGALQEPTRVFPQSATLESAQRLPLLVPGSRLHAGFLLSLIAAFALWWIVKHSAAGLRLRVVGINPDAARSASGINVQRTRFAAFLWSGALAGLAGAVQVAGVTYALYETLSPGYGYTAIAVALTSALNPLGVVVSGVFFGALSGAGSAMQREAGVPAVIVSVVEGAIVLLVVALAASRARKAAR